MGIDGKRQMLLHYAVSMVGGFLGGYAIINHSDIFGNAQTANLIHLVCKIFSGNLSGIVFLVLSFLTYMAGNVFCVLAEKYIKVDLRLISLVLTSCTVVLIGVMPSFANDYVSILPILFVTPIQWNGFREANGYVSSTIFSTNNLRQATMSLARYLIDKDEKQQRKAKFYWLTLASFHTGVALSCISSLFFGTSSIWFGFIPILLSAAAYAKLIGIKLSFTHKSTFKTEQ